MSTYGYDDRDDLASKSTPVGNVSWSYDVAGNLTRHGGDGLSVSYTYDALNRLHTVDTSFAQTVTYNYDDVGNLAGTQVGGLFSTGYTYDPLNRLTNMQTACGTGAPGCGPANTPVRSYAYTLGAAGNRLSVAELSGRSVNYGYDDLYRLTSENIVCGTGTPACAPGAVSYSYDSVGNRTQLNSTLPAIPGSGLLNYDANDRTSTDVYDANGNTTFNGQQNVYDFENRLVQRGGVSIVYDGDGNRVEETVAGVTTKYLVGEINPTGYAQVFAELSGTNSLLRGYEWGMQLEAVRDFTVNSFGIFHYYGHDGHGSVRWLTDSSGTITDTYDYDAFGNLISSTGTTINSYLFAGEQFDPSLGIYYNRARYYDQRQGRFWSMDAFQGNIVGPITLHKYLYASADPVDGRDPSGRLDLGELAITNSIMTGLSTQNFINAYPILRSVVPRGSRTDKVLKVVEVGVLIVGAYAAARTIYSLAGFARNFVNSYRAISAITDVVEADIAATGGLFAEADATSTTTLESRANESALVPVLRQQYEQQVENIAGLVEGFKQQGMTDQQIAEIVIPLRNNYKAAYRSFMSPEAVAMVEARNLGRYGDRLGPSVDYFLSVGKTYEYMVEAASRPGGADIDWSQFQ